MSKKKSATKKQKQKRRFTFEERSFIEKHYATMSDAEIAEHLGRSPKAIMKYRYRMGYLKGKNRPEDPLQIMDYIDKVGRIDPDRLSDEERRKYWKAFIMSTDHYKSLVKSEAYDNHELGLYVEKFSDLAASMSELNSSDIQTVCLICAEYVRQLRLLEEEKKAIDSGNKEEAATVRSAYDKSVATSLSLLKSLNQQRAQRRKGLDDAPQGSFFEIIRRVQERDKQREIEREASIYEGSSIAWARLAKMYLRGISDVIPVDDFDVSEDVPGIFDDEEGGGGDEQEEGGDTTKEYSNSRHEGAGSL